MLKKMVLQILICVVIYTIFYMIQNTNYVFSDDVIKKTNEILSYDMNIKNLYEKSMEYINAFIKKENLEIITDTNIIENQNNEQEIIEEKDSEILNNNENNANSQNAETQLNENIGRR